MLQGTTVEQQELVAQLRRKRLGGISHHRQPAALRWSVETRGRDNDGPSGFERPAQMRDVRIALLTRAEEMKHGAIVAECQLKSTAQSPVTSASIHLTSAARVVGVSCARVRGRLMRHPAR